METMPLSIAAAKSDLKNAADALQYRALGASIIHLHLLKQQIASSSNLNLIGTAQPDWNEDAYTIAISAGILAPSALNDPDTPQSVIKAALLGALGTLYHEGRHVEQFRTMSNYSDQHIPGLKNMAIEWLATYNNSSLYDQLYTNFSFELDAIAVGFERTQTHWDDYLRPYITEQELFDQIVGRCRTHGYPIDQIIIQSGISSPDGIIAALHNARDFTPKLREQSQLFSVMQTPDDDLFFRNLENNPKAEPLRNLWDNATLTDNERLKLIAGFNYHLKSKYRKTVAILSSDDLDIRGFDLKQCVRSCARYARLHPSLNLSALAAQYNDFETEEIQEPVDTMIPSGLAEDIEMSI